MRIALYARVSKDEASSTGQVQDPENQLQPMRRYCQAYGAIIQGEYVDRASGGNSDRPEFQRMLSQARQRHIDSILVWALDRFSREPMLNTLSYIRQLKQYNVGLRSMQEPWLDTTTPGVSELLIGIFAWVAAEEKRKISERTKAGLAARKAAGVKLGRPRKTPPPPVYKEKAAKP